MTAVTEQVLSRLQSAEAFPGEQLAHLLRTLRVAKLAGLIDDGQYTEFAESGHYLHHLYYATSEHHPEAIAECMFGYLEAVPDASVPSQVGNSNAGHDNLTEILQNPDHSVRGRRTFHSFSQAGPTASSSL